MTAQAEGTGRPRVAAVVLTWFDTEMTTRCVRSVLASAYPCDDVVIVDNGSDPPGCPILAEAFPDAHMVQLEANQGFTGGCNRGMEQALELGADYVFLLNNDTIVHENAIGHLVAAMEARPEAALATALLLFPGEERRIQFRHATVSRPTAQHMHHHEGEPTGPEHRATIETEFAPACAVVFRAQALREVGLFDESLFTNWEDYDLCCRFQDAGWTMLSVGEAEVVHAHGQTTGKISPFITYFFTRNRLICLFRHARWRDVFKKSPRFLRSVTWQVRRYGLDNWPAHRAFVRGNLDFLLGVRGKGNVPSNRKDRK